MKQTLSRLAALGLICGASAFAANSATGDFTANGNKVALSAVTVEAGLGEVGLLVTDEPLPAGCGVYDAFLLANAGKLRGVAVSISRDTRLKESAGLNAVFHESWNGLLREIGEPEFHIEQFDDEVLKGSIKLASGFSGDHSFSYSVDFDVSLAGARQPIEVSISGATDSEPAKAYVTFYEAMMGTRIDDGRKLVVKDMADQMTGDDADFFIEMFQDGHPRAATILSVDEKGKEATLSVEGIINRCMSSDNGTAKVEMIKEGGSWKVKLESWQM